MSTLWCHLRRETLTPAEQEYYLRLGRTTAPWWVRWLL